MRVLRWFARWSVAIGIAAATTLVAMFAAVKLNDVLWNAGWIHGDSGMEIVVYLFLGGCLGFTIGVWLAGVFIAKTRTSKHQAD